MQGEPDRFGDGSGPLDALGMVVRDRSDAIACGEGFFQGASSVQQRDGRHPHGGAIPEAPLRFGYGARDPFAEESPIASSRVAPAPALERRGRSAVVQDNVDDGSRADRVVGVRAQAVEQLEILRAAAVIDKVVESDGIYTGNETTRKVRFTNADAHILSRMVKFAPFSYPLVVVIVVSRYVVGTLKETVRRRHVGVQSIMRQFTRTQERASFGIQEASSSKASNASRRLRSVVVDASFGPLQSGFPGGRNSMLSECSS